MRTLISGALTGSGLGLFGGLFIGAGVHIIKNSNIISRSLFDDEYEDEDFNKKYLEEYFLQNYLISSKREFLVLPSLEQGKVF